MTFGLFWESQLAAFQELAAQTRPLSNKWYAGVHPDIRGATGTIDIALFSAFIQSLGLGSNAWIAQFVHGFPITGYLSQSGVFPLRVDPLPVMIEPEALFRTASERFAKRAKQRGCPHQQTVWDETIREMNRGWFSPPRKLNDSGRFLDKPGELVNPAFRFPIRQPDKIRMIDDLKHSQTNLSVVIGTPITLPTWDLLVELCFRARPANRDWVFGKVDHCSAYKNLPIRPADRPYATIVVRNPADQAFYGFAPTTQIFGSTASVLHYNVFSRLLVTIINRVFGIPTIGYYDDFGFLVPNEIGDEALTLIKTLCSLLGVKLKDNKCSVANPNDFLGLRGLFPNRKNGYALTISLSPEKSFKWKAFLDDIVLKRGISHAALEALIGRLGFAQNAVFSRFARCMLQPLYAKLYSYPYYENLHGRTLDTIKWWAEALTLLPPRVVYDRVSQADFILYTDASYENGSGMMASVLFAKTGINNSQKRVIDTTLISEASGPMIQMFNNTSTIFGLELMAVVLSLYFHRRKFTGKSIIVFIDNNAVLGALVRGQTSGMPAHAFISALWMIAHSHSVTVWFDRVPSGVNIADLPTRFKIPEYECENTLQFPPFN